MLTVRRTAGDDVQDRQVYLSVDGEDWVTLYYGQDVTRELSPGPPHAEGQQHPGAQDRRPSTCSPANTSAIQCINRAHWSGMLFMAFLGAAVLTVRLERERDT